MKPVKVKLIRHHPKGNKSDLRNISREQAIHFITENWNKFLGSYQTSMASQKLINRMEDISWKYPVLTFKIERHGSLRLTETISEIQEWSFNLKTFRADYKVVSYRQIDPKSTDEYIKEIAEELTTKIFNEEEDPRLKWKADKVMIRFSMVFPVGFGYKRIVKEKRKELKKQLEIILKKSGYEQEGDYWKKKKR